MKQSFILLLSLFGLISNPALAQTAIFTGTTLVGDEAPDPFGIGDFFGDHVASNSDWLMIGSAREDIDRDNDGIDPAQGDVSAGAVYIYKRTAGGPVFHQKIEGEGNTKNGTGDRFGAGLVLQGNVLFAGAANDSNFPGLVDPAPNPFQDFFFAGQVYVFNYDTGADAWVLVQKLTSDEPNNSGSFGSRTNSSHMELFSFGDDDSDGDSDSDSDSDGADRDPTIALIGEPENGSGLVPTLHVFKREKNSNQWERIQIIESPSAAVGTGFADKVEGIGDLALVPEGGFDPVVDLDMVHVYRVGPKGIKKKKGNLLPIQTLNAPGGLVVDPMTCASSFGGNGLSAANGIAAIGDPCDGTVGSNAGAVHVYEVRNNRKKSPLKLVQTLPNPAAMAESFFPSNFGSGKQTVTTDGNLIVAGTANVSFDPMAVPQLNVEMFARDASGLFLSVDSIASPAPGFLTIELYGQSVTLLGGDRLAIGQMSDPDGLSFKGQLFLFDIL